MGYTSVLLTAAPTETITLGAAVMHPAEYSVKLRCPVVRRVLADGRTLVDVLPEADAVLTVTGRVAVYENTEGTLLAALQDALASGAAFDFQFAGCRFAQMRLTAAELEKGKALREGICTVTMTGTLAGGAA